MKKSTTVKPTYEVFNPDVYLSSGITKGEVLELKDAFDLLDSTGSGKIDPMELKNLFKIFGVDSRSHSLEIAVSEATSNGRPVDFAVFLEIFTAYAYAPRSKDSFKKLFRLFDDENMGCITAKNLRRVLKELDLQLEESEIQEMVERADLNNDGVVTEDEFYLIMTRISAKI